MKRFSEQFKKEADRTKLRAVELQDLRGRVVSYMEYHPLPADRKTSRSGAISSDPFVSVKLPWQQWKGAFAVCAVVTLIVVPFAAENSLPGDVLYAVKVNFNEEVRSSLSFSSYEKVEWETKRLERRLAEVRLLAGEGKLTDEVEQAAAQAVAEHTAAAKKELAILRESDGEGAAVAELSFATALEVQAGALASTISRTNGDASAAGSVSAALNTAQADVQATENAPSFERLLALVEQRTTEAQELFISLKPVAGESAKADIERRLQDIKRKHSEAIAIGTEPVSTEVSESELSTDNVATFDPVAARLLLKDSLQSTEKLILYMTDIELATRVSVEDLVPATPTDEELMDSLARLRSTLDTQVKAVTARAGAKPSEKIAYGLAQIESFVTAAKTAENSKNYSAAIDSTENAIQLATDMLRTLDTLSLPGSPVTPTASSSDVVASSSESTTEVIEP